LLLVAISRVNLQIKRLVSNLRGVLFIPKNVMSLIETGQSISRRPKVNQFLRIRGSG